jgi:hypothetical protein
VVACWNKRSALASVLGMPRRVTREEIILRRFTTIVVLMLVLMRLSEAAVKAEIESFPTFNHMQYTDQNTRWQTEMLNALRRQL